MTTTTKCPACDGYGTRPHRGKLGKVTPCKACGRTGLVTAPAIQTVPFAAPSSPVVPFTPSPPWAPSPFPPILPNSPFVYDDGRTRIRITDTTGEISICGTNYDGMVLWTEVGRPSFTMCAPQPDFADVLVTLGITPADIPRSRPQFGPGGQWRA